MKKILLSLIIAGCLFACDDETLNPIVQPIAQTSEPMYITSTTATLVGNVLTGGGTVQERGFYYTEYTYDMKVSDYTPITLQQEVMKGTQVVCTQDSEFSYSLENLEGDTDYYYLAYARTEMGISYGDPVLFATSDGDVIPVLSITETVKDEVNRNVIIKANIDAPGGAPIEEMGLVWSKEVAQPTIENGTKINIDVVLGAFEISLSDLVTFTKYYYRIFAKNKYGVGYSEPMMVMFVGDKFTDPRDKNTYKIKQYGNCIWMVENFRYVPADRLNKGIWVQGYNGSSAEEAMQSENYAIYGCLYDYQTAKDLAPEGWHLATDAEWNELEKLAGVSEELLMKEEDWRGNSNDRLKADTWQGNGNWSNELGFNIHPGGKQWCGGAFQDFKQAGLYWTSTMNDHRADGALQPFFRWFSGGPATGRFSNFPECVGMSERYVMD